MILDEIVKDKLQELTRLEVEMPLGVLTSELSNLEKPRGFSKQISIPGEMAIIAEVKKASPVKGLLCKQFAPEKLAANYEKGGAKAISVITEQKYFLGHADYINRVKKVCNLPVLRKDFIVTEYQIYESRVLGADAILLIAAILDDYLLPRLIKLTRSLGMDVLVEVHNRSELESALAAEAPMIGINNRDLKTFIVDLNTTLELAPLIPSSTILVSESGISAR